MAVQYNRGLIDLMSILPSSFHFLRLYKLMSFDTVRQFVIRNTEKGIKPGRKKQKTHLNYNILHST